MSNLADTDARQLYNGEGDYKPSERAAKASRQANTTGSNPVYAEKQTSGNEEARKGKGADDVTNHAGKKAPGVDAAYTSSQDPNLSTRSFGERSA